MGSQLCSVSSLALWPQLKSACRTFCVAGASSLHLNMLELARETTLVFGTKLNWPTVCRWLARPSLTDSASPGKDCSSGLMGPRLGILFLDPDIPVLFILVLTRLGLWPTGVWVSFHARPSAAPISTLLTYGSCPSRLLELQFLHRRVTLPVFATN